MNKIGDMPVPKAKLFGIGKLQRGKCVLGNSVY